MPIYTISQGIHRPDFDTRYIEHTDEFDKDQFHAMYCAAYVKVNNDLFVSQMSSKDVADKMCEMFGFTHVKPLHDRNVSYD